MQKILLHTCCAPCSAAVIEWLLQNNIQPTLFYFNPNIFPEQEYLIRKSECTRYAQSLGIEIMDGDYNHADWLKDIKGLENETERGNRCLVCFKIRLGVTAQYGIENGFEIFATTLASSRWKKLEQIAEAGYWATAKFPGINFFEKNWRKDGLSERRNQLLALNNFYNQPYCGCEFSIRNNK